MVRTISFIPVVFLSCVAVLNAQTEADLVVEGAKILTVDAAFSIHDGMAIKDGRILAVGDKEEMAAYRGSATRVMNLAGKTVMPGLMDSHSHAASAAVREFDHPIPDMETLQDVLDYIGDRAKLLTNGEWVWIDQVFLTRLREQRYPTRSELDQIAPHNPVVFQTGPDASVNSMALELSGIDENWSVEDGGPGYAEKDPKTGRLTGILRSCTRYLKFESPDRKPSPEERADYLRRLLEDYNRVGITAIGERDADASEVGLYTRLRQKGELTVRSFVSVHLDSGGPVEAIRERVRAVASGPLFMGDGLLRVAGVKTYLDGGMLTGSAYMDKPWGVSAMYGISDPQYRGLLFIPPPRLKEIMQLCMESGVQFTAHSVGDGAVRTFVDSVDELRHRFDVRAQRPVICHSNFMSEETVRRVAELGICTDIQPAWLYLDARTLRAHFGYERLSWFQPLRSLFALGAVSGGGSDHMQKIGSRRSINFYDPWLAMWVTLTRKARWLDEPLHPEQALSRVEAIRFYTINNAYVLKAERDLGSLEPGKLADFIVISEDPLTCSLEQLRGMHVEQTYLEGERVFPRM